MNVLVLSRPSIARRRRSPATSPREISLLRKSVGALADGLDRCVHCARTPLVGEQMYVYVASSGERLVCELCRPRHREQPARSELVRSSEHERAVKVRPGAA